MTAWYLKTPLGVTVHTYLVYDIYMIVKEAFNCTYSNVANNLVDNHNFDNLFIMGPYNNDQW